MSDNESRAPRQPRASESRSAGERQKSWVNPNNLLDPHPVDGVTFRWVRAESLGEADKVNMHKKLREGWEICSPKDHPEMEYLSADGNSEYIEQGGLILCKTTDDIMSQRKAHFERLAKGQIEAVDNHLLRQSDDRMPVLAPERKTTVRFGKGARDDVS